MKKHTKYLIVSLVAFLAVLLMYGPIRAHADSYDGFYPSITLDVAKYVQIPQGCGVSSMAMIEGGFFEKDLTKIYPNTASGRSPVYNQEIAFNSNNETYAYWNGYLSKNSTSEAAYLKVLYEQLAMGYPVIVHRYSEATGHHYSVVYAYTGSTTTLEKSGFKVINTGTSASLVTSQTLTTWTSKAGISNWNYIVRCAGMTADTIVQNMVFAINHPATYHKQGTSQAVLGRIVDNVKITKVTVGIYESDGTTAVYKYSASPNAKNYDVNNADSTMLFAELSNGTYYYKVIAEDEDGRAGTYSFKFNVVSSKPSSGSTAKPDITLKVVLNANGGTVSPGTVNVKWGSLSRTNKYGTLPIPVRTGYTFDGWYSAASGGTKVTVDTVVNNAGWQTLYAHWTKASYTVNKYVGNVNGIQMTDQGCGFYSYEQTLLAMKNYLRPLNEGTVGTVYKSRDTSVTTVSLDTNNQHNGYYSMKIVNSSVGSSGKDLQIETLTQGNAPDNGYVGDSREMILSFWAKCSKTGTKMYFRWGYESEYRSVSLTTSWKKYTVRMDKTPAVNMMMHPYIDTAGTVWISEMQLEDGTNATDYAPVYYKLETEEYSGGCYDLGEPQNQAGERGWKFKGWYTQMVGGTKITDTTPVQNGNLNVYAQWEKQVYAPYVTGVSMNTDGITFKWSASQGAANYVIGRNDGTLNEVKPKIGETAGTSYTDKTPLMGVSYLYCITAVSASDSSVSALSNGGAFYNPFTDVKSTDNFFKSASWGFNNKIISGTSKTTFSPQEGCARYQIAVMMYKYAGKPSVDGLTMPFKDVDPKASYAKAVIWAYNNGIVGGTSRTTFSPYDTCTRYQIAKMLYKLAGKPSTAGMTMPFTDVKSSDSFYDAVLWAYNKGITSGTSSTKFSPYDTCRRYQIITFLYKYNSL